MQNRLHHIHEHDVTVRSGVVGHPPSPWLSFWRSLRSLGFSPASLWVQPVLFAGMAPPPKQNPKSPPSRPRVKDILRTITPIRRMHPLTIPVVIRRVTSNLQQPATPKLASFFSRTFLEATSTTWLPLGSVISNRNPRWSAAQTQPILI